MRTPDHSSPKLPRRSPTARGALLIAVFSLIGSSGCRAKTEPVAAEKARDPASQAKQARDLSGVRIEAVEVQPSERYLELNLPGEVEAHKDALLAAPLGGYIERVYVAKGDQVKKGQGLISVDAATHSARLARVEAELESARRELARAESLSGRARCGSRPCNDERS